MIPLTTERLEIRNFDANDWESLHALIVQYEASEFAIYDHQWPTTSEEIKKIIVWFANGDDFLVVWLKETGQFIGFVALNLEQSEGHSEFNLGYIFDADFHGRGYATEACRAVLHRAFGSLSAERVFSGTAAVNQASCRLLERLGFNKISQSRGSFCTGPDGQPLEFLGYQYALTRDEWEQTIKPG